jgi:hypothetical protein
MGIEGWRRRDGDRGLEKEGWDRGLEKEGLKKKGRRIEGIEVGAGGEEGEKDGREGRARRRGMRQRPPFNSPL